MPVVTIRIERSAADRPVSQGRRTRRRVLVAVAVVATASLAATGLADATTSTSSTPSVYTALNSVKVLAGRVIKPATSVQLVVAGGSTSVPVSATSVLVKVDVSAGTSKGRLDVFPFGAAAPAASMRWTAGQSETQQITVRVGQSRKILLENRTGKVTVTVHLLGYYAPPDMSTTYVTSPPSSEFLFNSAYIFETSANSYTEYFTRYDDVAVPALTQSALQNGSLQVFMTPSPSNNPNAWLPLPYQFDSSFGYTYNFTYVARAGHVVLMFYFIQTSPTATLPTLSTFPMNTYNFKIVVMPHSSGASPPISVQQRPAGLTTNCTSIPGGKTCTVSR